MPAGKDPSTCKLYLAPSKLLIAQNLLTNSFFFFRDEYMVAMVSLSCFFLCFNQFFNHLDIELFSGIIMELCMVANK